MRVSTQLLLGYLMAVGAAAAIAVLSHLQIREVSSDTRHIASEWREMDVITGSLAMLHRARTEPGLGPRLAALSEALDDLASGEGEEEGEEHEHSMRELAIFQRMAAITREAAHAEPARLAELEAEAHEVFSSFPEVEAGRVARSLAEIKARGTQLRLLNLGVGLTLVLAPLLFFLHLRRRIARPLGQIQARVEALAGDGGGRRRPADMTELKEAIDRMAVAVEERQQSLREEVEARTAQLRHADRLGGLGRIAAAVAHELNNPLASIGLCIDGMRAGLAGGRLDPAEARRYLETLGKEITRCTGITRKMLTYARYRPAPSAEVTSREIVRQSMDLVAAQARRARVSLQLEDRSGDARVAGDVDQLEQVIVNLLLNAIAASPAGESVTVHSREEDGQVVITVCDRGPGVPPAEREEIFRPFVTTKRPGEGTGLGLAISREIVEAHGGRLDLVGEGPGAAFAVRLPARAGVSA